MEKILIVEDDPSVGSMVRQLLHAEGYAAVVTASVDRAWEALQREEPDAAVVDLRLRADDGWRLIELIRGCEPLEGMPVVIMTAVPQEEVAERAHRYGCEYLAKPFSAAGLLDRLRLALQQRGLMPGMKPVSVVLLMDGYRVEGTAYIPSDVRRFSDAWEAIIGDARSFIPLTDARVTSIDGARVLAEHEFIEVRKHDVRVALPME